MDFKLPGKVSSVEFEMITEPLIESFWNDGYFTIPLPGAGMKEFKLDMPAFERFDLVAMRWDKSRELDDIDVRVVECKLRPSEAISQARTYQLCAPDVYIASNKALDNRLMSRLDRYGIGYIMVSEGIVRTVLESRRSSLFNINFYRSEMLPRVVTLLLFNDFITGILGVSRDEVKNVDYGFKKNYLWISNISASKGVQWSMVYDADKGLMRFGLNLESVNVVKNVFHGKSRREVKSFFKWIKELLPGNFLIKFENRCPRCPQGKLMPGMKHEAFKELGWSMKPLAMLTKEELNFIADKIRVYDYVELGLWAIIFKQEELLSWTKTSLLDKAREYKEKYFDKIFEKLNSLSYYSLPNFTR